MQLSLPAQIVSRVAETVDRFGMFERHGRVAVAMSGGKDSVLLSLALRSLGYQVVAVAVDLGYDSAWRGRIEQLCREGGLALEVVDARIPRASSIQAVRIARKDELRANLEVIDALSEGPCPSYSPCTSCYNAKAVTLDAALSALDLDRIAFGHHATDAAASLLKSAFMYADRWRDGNETYSPDNFRHLADSFREEWLAGCEGQQGSQTLGLATLVREGLASTDEPPVQHLIEASGRLIVRPMFNLWEGSIRSAVASIPIQTEPSGCSHTMLEATRTPREIVQYEVLEKLELARDLTAIELLVALCVDEHGWLKSDARRHRDQILGSTYKPNLNAIPKY